MTVGSTPNGVSMGFFCRPDAARVLGRGRRRDRRLRRRHHGRRVLGQWQAASAIGLSRLLAFRLVILPQAMRRMVPPLVSQAVLQLKNTALLSVVAIPELMQRSSVMVSDTFRPLEVYTAVAAMYFVLLFPMVLLSKRLELRVQ